MKLTYTELMHAQNGTSSELTCRIASRLYDRATFRQIPWSEAYETIETLWSIDLAPPAPLEQRDDAVRRLLRGFYAIIPVLLFTLVTSACVGGMNPQDTYKQTLARYCEFLTPSLVTARTDRLTSESRWKCPAAIADYNRLFEVDLTYVEADPTDLTEAR